MELHPTTVLVGTHSCRATDGQPQPTSPKKSGSEILLIAVFLFLPQHPEEVRQPGAARLSMQKEQDPGSWLHLLHRHQRAAFSANSSDGRSE